MTALLLLLLVQAQRPDTIAFAGAAGIYVWTGAVVSRAHPVDGVVGFQIERRPPGSGEWRRVVETHAVASARELFAPLDSATRAAVRRALRAGSDNAAWDSIVQHPGAEALARIIGDERIRLALGIYALDRGVRAGERWEYRVTALGADGRPGRQTVSVPVAFPAAALATPVHTLSVESRADGADLQWYIEPGHPQAKSLEVWRRQGQAASRFERIDSITALLVVGDSFQVSYADRGLRPGEMYQYYVVPRDAFFNRGPASDTVTVYTVTLATPPLPDSLAVTADDSLGLVVSWRFTAPTRARTIRVYRAASQDGPWRQAAELPAARGNARWPDALAEAMRVYYYRLTVTGLRGEESPPTASVFGVYRSARAPAPPNGVRAAPTPNGRGVRIVWLPAADAGVLGSGYVVSRGHGVGDSITANTPLEIVSPLLGGRDTVFVDTSAAVAPGREYAYTVQAVSGSGVRSGYSAPAFYAPPEAATPLPAPTTLDATVYGARIRLSWDDMTEVEFGVGGYLVLRRVMTTPAPPRPVPFDTLTRQPLGQFENRFVDSTVTPGRLYEYAVVSVGRGGEGRKSELSPTARGLVPVERPPAPVGIRVFPADSGLRIAFDEVRGWAAATMRVYRYERGDEPQRIGEVPVTALRYLDRGARPGVRYFYYLTVASGGVESAPSLEVSGRR